MLFALVYSWLRLLLDLVDVRLRVHNPEAELLLLRHQLRVVRRQVKRPQLNSADRTIIAALSQRMNRAALDQVVISEVGTADSFGRWVGSDTSREPLAAMGASRVTQRPASARVNIRAGARQVSHRMSPVPTSRPDRSAEVSELSDVVRFEQSRGSCSPTAIGRSSCCPCGVDGQA